MPAEFKNEPLTDFRQRDNADAMRSALEEVRASLGETAPLWIDGNEITAGGTFASVNPARPDEVIARFQKAEPKHADQAIEAAARAFESWRATPARLRAELLFTAASRMRARKHWYSAWLVYEVGKTWAE